MAHSLTDQRDAGRPRLERGCGGRADAFLEGAALLDVALKVARIETFVPDRFVDMAKLADRKLRRAKFCRKGRVLKLGSRQFDGIPHDLFVVEC